MSDAFESAKKLKSGYTSDELFHFVGHGSPLNDDNNFSILRKVLSEGCISHPPHDSSGIKISYTVDWRESLLSEKLIIPDITCFADIPRKSLKIHTNKYGKFGLGLPKDLLIKYGARPVTYFPMFRDDHLSANGRSMLKDIESVIRGFNDHLVEPQDSEPEWSRKTGEIPGSAEDVILPLESILLREFLGFIKAFNSDLSDDHPDNFYLEREWRKLGNMPFNLEMVTSVTVAEGYKSEVEKYFPNLSGPVIEI